MSKQAVSAAESAVHSALYSPTILTEIESDFRKNIKYLFDQMVRAHGPNLKGIYNSWSWASAFSRVVSMLSRSKDGLYSIDQEALDATAKAHALGLVDKWEAKILAKLGPVDACKVQHVGSLTFSISAQRAGHAIHINQSCILKVSTRGNLFNQFPSRLYIDGRFVSERQYHKFFEAHEAVAAAE